MKQKFFPTVMFTIIITLLLSINLVFALPIVTINHKSTINNGTPLRITIEVTENDSPIENADVQVRFFTPANETYLLNDFTNKKGIVAITFTETDIIGIYTYSISIYFDGELIWSTPGIWLEPPPSPYKFEVI